jgi:TMEM175 potassium channel family protein
MKPNRHPKAIITQRREAVRLLALSDGLFATVLTLLVLDLRAPETLNAGGGNVSSFLKWLGPHLFSYLLTFVVAGTYWLAHHRNFEHMDHVDRGLLGYNLLFLLFIGLLPFTTATVSVGSSGSVEFAFHWSMYAANLLLAGVMLSLIWAYALSHQLVKPETAAQERRYITVRQLATPAVFLLSIVTEWLFPRFFPGPYTLLLIPVALWGVDRRFGEGNSRGRPMPMRGSELLWRAGTILPWLLLIGLAVWATTL